MKPQVGGFGFCLFLSSLSFRASFIGNRCILVDISIKECLVVNKDQNNTEPYTETSHYVWSGNSTVEQHGRKKASDR